MPRQAGLRLSCQTLYGMKTGVIRLLPKHIGTGVAFVYGYGMLLGIFGFIWSWAAGRNVPQLTWWQLLLAPFAFGIGALALEALGTFLFNGFSFKRVQSTPRLTAGKVAVVVFMLLLVIGLPMYLMSQA